MKKTFKSSIKLTKLFSLFTLISLLNYSCKEQNLAPDLEGQIPNEQISNKQTKRIITDASVIEKFKSNISFFNPNSKIASKNTSSIPSESPDKINFILDSIYEMENIYNSDTKFIFIEGKLNNNAIALYKYVDKDGNIGDNFMFCETEKENEDSYVINYYNQSLQITNSIKIIPSTKQILTKKYNINGFKAKVNNDDDSESGWGQDTMDCINDAYSNHGWASVWAWVQTAFIPETGIIIAGTCAGINF